MPSSSSGKVTFSTAVSPAKAHLASWADRVVFLRDGHVVDQTVAPPGPESLLAAR